MTKKNLWITLLLTNLCIVALLGTTLRTKFLFPLSFLNYQNFLSAHSHFAFGGWVTLGLMVLSIDKLLDEEQQQKRIYQWMLWGIEINSFGMLLTFPFEGYALLSIIFSTAFIFFTYAFSWVFIHDIKKTSRPMPVKLLSLIALSCLVISSAGPFTLAYILASQTGDAILYKDAIYFYLHFQYNGFFTLSVFALFLNRVAGNVSGRAGKKLSRFALLLCLSIVPAFFLTLLWHADNVFVRGMAFGGCALIFLTLAAFCALVFDKNIFTMRASGLASTLLLLSMVSFAIKMILQMGTIIPSLANAVFGYRPIIIGFLHLVFLGFVSFYILSSFWEDAAFPLQKKISAVAVIFFAVAVILNETILLVDGIGLMLYVTYSIYPWLLWAAAILLLSSAILMLTARLKAPAHRLMITKAIV